MKLDRYHYHELLHTISIISDMCEDHLKNHHAGEKYKPEVVKIQAQLQGLYTKVSNDSDELFEGLGNLCGDKWLKTGKL